MNILYKITLLVLSIALSLCITPKISIAEVTSRDQIIADANNVADVQLKAIGTKVQIDWTWGVMYVGYADLSHVSTKGAAYQKSLSMMADSVKWTPLTHKGNPFHADDFCICQTLLDLYADDRDPAHLTAVKSRLDALAQHLDTTQTNAKPTYWWCDALFMAPPALARMSAITKDPKYIDAMDKEFWRTTALLYDHEEHLFYRDATFLAKKDTNGKKVFWSRGNGWVLGGLAHILQYMPSDYPSRPKYETLFKEMSAKLVTLQQADGTWCMNLEDPEQNKGPESSGTSLFTFALAWGMNNGLLDKPTYLPVVAKAWSAMLAARREDGLPGFSQSEASAPGAVQKNSTAVYTTGGYLLAATQLQQLAPFDLPLIDLSDSGIGRQTKLSNTSKKVTGN